LGHSIKRVPYSPNFTTILPTKWLANMCSPNLIYILGVPSRPRTVVRGGELSVDSFPGGQRQYLALDLTYSNGSRSGPSEAPVRATCCLERHPRRQPASRIFSSPVCGKLRPPFDPASGADTGQNPSDAIFSHNIFPRVCGLGGVSWTLTIRGPAEEAEKVVPLTGERGPCGELRLRLRVLPAHAAG